MIARTERRREQDSGFLQPEWRHGSGRRTSIEVGNGRGELRAHRHAEPSGAPSIGA